jgi:hypothetical protein
MMVTSSGRNIPPVCPKCDEDPLTNAKVQSLIRAVKPPEDDSEKPPHD